MDATTGPATVLAALTAAAAVLVVASGAAKIIRPAAPAAMFAGLLAAHAPRLPRRSALLRPAARVAGLVEVVVAVGALALGGTLPVALLAGAYALFAAVAAALVGRPVSCGCFGRADTPVSRGHLAVTVLGCAVCAAAAVAGPAAWGGLFTSGAAIATAGPVLVGLVAWCAYLCMTALPALSSVRRSVEAS